VGKATDLGPISHQVFISSRALKCFDVLPNKQTARIVWSRPSEAIDVDLTTGQQWPAPLLPDTYRSGCPQLSTDGRRLLYVKDDENKRTQIMLSSRPDGSDARPVTEGTMPAWLPSGEEFVYAFDNRRAAAFTLPKTRLLFPDSAPVEKMLQQITTTETGDKIALLFLDGKNRNSVEIYNYPSMSLVQRSPLDLAVGGMQFDSARQNLQISVPDSGVLGLAELTPRNELSRLAQISGTDILAGYRTKQGFTTLAWRFSYSVEVRWPDGQRELLGPSISGRASVSRDHGVMFDTRLEDGRWVIAHQTTAKGKPQLVTEGPMDMYPSFQPDGLGFVHVRVRDGAVVACRLAARDATDCRLVHADPLGPRFTTVSPDGTQVAYQTTHGTGSRLRIVSLSDGSMRDLGIYRSVCPPLWSSARALWTYEDGASNWREVEDLRGKPTGRSAKHEGEGPSACDRPPQASAVPPLLTVQRLENRTTEIRTAAGF